MKKMSFAFGSALLLFVSSGCLSVSVGDHKSANKPPTLEQQLNDLEKARKSGAITEEQYDAQRTKLMESQ